jgi:hypothetical protein
MGLFIGKDLVMMIPIPEEYLYLKLGCWNTWHNPENPPKK